MYSLYHENNLLGQDSTYPYNFVWNNPEIGSYNLYTIASSNNNCRDTSTVKITVNTITDLNGKSDQNLQIMCTPNPSSSSFSVLRSGAFSYAIYNLLGVEQEKGEANQQVEIGKMLPSGSYLLHIQDDDVAKTIRITKE